MTVARRSRRLYESRVRDWQVADTAWRRIDWDLHRRACSINGRRVSYVDIGGGPAVVLVHGQGGSWRYWLRVLPALAVHCRVIAVDLPGFGDSDPVVGESIIAEQVASLHGLMRHLGLARAVFVGHSMGGLATMRVGVEHPGTAAGIVLVDAGGSPMGKSRTALVLGSFRVVHAVLSVGWIARTIARNRIATAVFFAPAVAESGSVSEELALELVPRMATPGFLTTMRAAAAELGSIRPGDIAAPTLVIWGTRDRILTVSGGRALAARIPGARFVAIESVGHCPMVECPAEFASLVTDFVISTRGSRVDHKMMESRADDVR